MNWLNISVWMNHLLDDLWELMYVFTEENIPLATYIYLFVSNVLSFAIVEMCITVTLSLFTKNDAVIYSQSKETDALSNSYF